MVCNLGWQKRLFSIEEAQFAEMQEFIRRKALYNLALLEVEEPLKELEAEAVKIRYIHRQHSNVSKHLQHSLHTNLFIWAWGPRWRVWRRD